MSDPPSAKMDLASAADDLKRRFGPALGGPYVIGKTMLRDALCERRGLSQLEAEELCDSLEKAGFIRFERSAEQGPSWWITTDART